MSTQMKRMASRPAVRFGLADLLIAVMQRKAVTTSAMIPTQRISGLVEKVRLEMEKFKFLESED